MKILCIPRLWPVLEMQVGDEPCIVLKICGRKRRVLAKPANDIRSGERRRGIDHMLAMNAPQLIAREANNIDAIRGRHDRDHHTVTSNILTYLLEKMVDELPIALGHRDERLRLRSTSPHARTEIKKACPRRGLLQL